MKKTTLVLALVSLAVALAIGSAFAYDWSSMSPADRFANTEIPESVRLTAEQQVEIDKIEAHYANRFDTLNRRLIAINTVIGREQATANPDPVKIKRLRDRRAGTIIELEILTDQMNADIRKVLTEEQREYYGDNAFCPRGSTSMGGSGYGMGGPGYGMRRMGMGDGRNSCGMW